MNENYIRELIRQELANLGDSMRPGAANALRGLDPDYETGRVRLEAQVSSTRHDDQMRAPVHKGEIVPFEFHFSVQLDQPGAITGVVVEAPSPVSGSFQIDGGDPFTVADFNTVVGRLKGGNHVIKGVVETGGLGYVQLGWDTAGNGTATPTATGSGNADFSEAAPAADLFADKWSATDDITELLPADGSTVLETHPFAVVASYDSWDIDPTDKSYWIVNAPGVNFTVHHVSADGTTDLASWSKAQTGSLYDLRVNADASRIYIAQGSASAGTVTQTIKCYDRTGTLLFTATSTYAGTDTGTGIAIDRSTGNVAWCHSNFLKIEGLDADLNSLWTVTLANPPVEESAIAMTASAGSLYVPVFTALDFSAGQINIYDMATGGASGNWALTGNNRFLYSLCAITTTLYLFLYDSDATIRRFVAATGASAGTDFAGGASANTNLIRTNGVG